MSMCVVHEYWTFCIFVFVLFPFSFAVVHIIFTVHTVAWLLREYYNYNYCVCCHSRDCCLSFSIFLYLAPVCKSHRVCCLSFFFFVMLLLLFSFERFEWASGKVGREKRVRRKIFPSVQIQFIIEVRFFSMFLLVFLSLSKTPLFSQCRVS